VLVNNAGTAFKGADPTPFEKQTKPTLDVNFRGTVDLTEALLPLLRGGDDPRIVNVASMAGRLGQVSPERQAQFSSEVLTMPALRGLVDDFEKDVQDGTYSQRGWGKSNYGLSKLALIAATKVMARDEPGIKVNCCCPGYCDTDMTSHKGPRPPAEGARNAVCLVVGPRDRCPTGTFYQNERPSAW
jgi:carbonyl reductase 1